MKIIITAAHIEYLKKSRIFTSSSGNYDDGWLKLGGSYNTVGCALIEPYSAMFIGPRLCSIGAFSYTKSYFPPQFVKIGRYCAIAAQCSLMPDNHPQSRVGMGGFDYVRTAPFQQFEADNGYDAPKISPGMNSSITTIGNDVWIGQGALLKRGIKIGDGAVIAARSIVTRDVPSYAVVAGAPAVIKKFRFDEKTIERFHAAQWWEYSYDQFAGMDTTNPSFFLPVFEDAVSNERLARSLFQTEDMHVRFRNISKNMGILK